MSWSYPIEGEGYFNLHDLHDVYTFRYHEYMAADGASGSRSMAIESNIIHGWGLWFLILHLDKVQVFCFYKFFRLKTKGHIYDLKCLLYSNVYSCFFNLISFFHFHEILSYTRNIFFYLVKINYFWYIHDSSKTYTNWCKKKPSRVTKIKDQSGGKIM